MLSELICLCALLMQLTCLGQLLAPVGLWSCSAASFSKLFCCLFSVQVTADCILSGPFGRCCSLIFAFLIELRGCSVCYCVFTCASGLAEYSPSPLPSVVPRCPFPCRLLSVSCTLIDLLLSTLLPLGVSTWCVVGWFFHSLTQETHHVQWALLGFFGR